MTSVPATPESKRALGLWGSTHPPLPDRINSLNALLANYPTDGQKLAERYAWYVNPPAFTHEGGTATAEAPAPAAGGNEVDGVVVQGVVVLNGGKLPDGTKVKVRPQQ